MYPRWFTLGSHQVTGCRGKWLECITLMENLLDIPRKVWLLTLVHNIYRVAMHGSLTLNVTQIRFMTYGQGLGYCWFLFIFPCLLLSMAFKDILCFSKMCGLCSISSCWVIVRGAIIWIILHNRINENIDHEILFAWSGCQGWFIIFVKLLSMNGLEINCFL